MVINAQINTLRGSKQVVCDCEALSKQQLTQKHKMRHYVNQWINNVITIHQHSNNDVFILVFERLNVHSQIVRLLKMTAGGMRGLCCWKLQLCRSSRFQDTSLFRLIHLDSDYLTNFHTDEQTHKYKLKSCVCLQPAEHFRKKKSTALFLFPRRVINIPMIPWVFCEEYVETDHPMAVCRGLEGCNGSSGCYFRMWTWKRNPNMSNFRVTNLSRAVQSYLVAEKI